MLRGKRVYQPDGPGQPRVGGRCGATPSQPRNRAPPHHRGVRENVATGRAWKLGSNSLTVCRLRCWPGVVPPRRPGHGPPDRAFGDPHDPPRHIRHAIDDRPRVDFVGRGATCRRFGVRRPPAENADLLRQARRGASLRIDELNAQSVSVTSPRGLKETLTQAETAVAREAPSGRA